MVVESEVVIESGIINEFIDEAWPMKSPSLMPPHDQPFRRATARIWIDFVNKKLVPPFYCILQKQTSEEQEQAVDDFNENLSKFVKGMDIVGPFFCGKDIGNVDIAFIPWALRMFILKKYRNYQPTLDEFSNDRYQKWLDAVVTHPAVLATVQDDDKLLANYEKYANNTTNSLVAITIITNKPLP